MAIKPEILNALPVFCETTPYQIKGIAVKDACLALSQGKQRVKKGIIPKFFLHFRSRKAPKQSAYIPKSAITGGSIYPTILGKGLKLAEPLPEVVRDSRLVKYRGRFYIQIPVSCKRKLHVAENQGRVVAIDPGIRTFASFFSENSIGYLGQQDFGRIQRLGWHLDQLISKHSNTPKASYRKAMNALRQKIADLIDELHWKVANFFAKNFDVILLPTFETSELSKRGARALRSKSARMLITFSHYKFKQRLKHKAFEYGSVVVDVNEAYTSKTNSWTGDIWHGLGGRKTVKVDGIKINRDLNGARGIFLRALSDTTWLREKLAKWEKP